jgi:imidazolonepropionase-like amidohydrolase
MQVDLIRVTKDDEKAVEKSLVLWFDKAREAAKRQTDNAEPVSDPRVQALIPCVERRLPVFFTADRESEIRLAIKLADLLEVRAIVRGGRDAWKVAPLLAEKNIPVIVGPVLSLPFKSHDPFDAPYRNPGRLHAAGVPIAFQSTDGSFSRNLSDNAGAAVAYGLPHATAIRALTLGAAEILGVSDQLGSITPGKTGNLIITNGDPLEIRTQVRHVFIEGRPVSLETRHTRLYRQFRHRVPPRRLKNF